MNATTDKAPYISYIAEKLKLSEQAIAATLTLIDDGATLPFICRYRKEATGGLNETAVSAIATEAERIKELLHRKQSILSTLADLQVLTSALRERIESCWDTAELEDLYLPYKPKRKTRAEMARQRGLAPLAQAMRRGISSSLHTYASRFVSTEVPDEEAALQGARDIIAEEISENATTRKRIRTLFRKEGIIQSKVVKDKEDDADKFKDYFNFQEPVHRCSSHRYLALQRGAKAGFLRIGISPDEEKAKQILSYYVPSTPNACSAQMQQAANEAYKRLIKPSVENEVMNLLRERAEEEAIQVFARNLQQLLMSAPLGAKRVLAIDPGFRTGCKVVCLDEQGSLLHHTVIFPHPPHNKQTQAESTLLACVKDFRIQAIAVGSGTAGRETEAFVRRLSWEQEIPVFSVSEDGASVYSASPIAREEFPNEDITVRGAVSIGRRLIDPLAELVKIDPKAIGVGQYQHDVNATALKNALDRTVEFCVNAVGVELNTAGKHLLTYVAGLGPTLAQNIVNYRKEKGPFRSRRELLNVPRLGAKAYEQCAGFLRIAQGDNPLDKTAVHPERYAIVEKMAEDLDCSVNELLASEALRKKIQLKRYVTSTCGLPTLQDILSELEKPGRDPRPTLCTFRFNENIHTLEDLSPGMWLPGIVTNITSFGCFVDIGLHEQGLIHISQLSERHISDPSEVVALRQQVNVRVLAVDTGRKRIGLSLIAEDKNIKPQKR